ncbi:MAG: class I SAM-dependent methyltransferase [Candidatus Peribacteria bacterium]|jgi:ubiquinone/menaquinone biosynthesis C-methylase UbiE|nr:class I SAM-dependent methyltransferase [Candidatus Peribacteria bacterium]
MTYDSKHTEILAPKAGYDAVADQYGQHHKHLNTFYRINFLRFLPRKSSFDIIDLGAGDGRMFYQLNEIPHGAYVALDISKEMLLHHPRGAKHLVADLEKKLPLEDDTFDVAVSFFTTEHLEHLETFFSEAYRILRSEGKLFIGHFFQRRAFEWTANNRNFKIQQYKRSTEELQELAESAFFQTEIVSLYDKSDHTGDLLVCNT